MGLLAAIGSDTALMLLNGIAQKVRFKALQDHIAIAHALELPATDAAAFGRLFADYELLQPFVQCTSPPVSLRV